MKHVLKGAAVMAGIIIVNMIISIICNKNGVDLNSTGMSTMSALCALFIYEGLIKKEKENES